MGRTDDVAAGPTRRMIPSPEKAYPEYFQNQPFQPARIDEQAVGKNQHVSQLQKVPGQRDAHQPPRNGPGDIEKLRPADDQHEQRKHHDEIDLVEKRRRMTMAELRPTLIPSLWTYRIATLVPPTAEGVMADVNSHSMMTRKAAASSGCPRSARVCGSYSPDRGRT